MSPFFSVIYIITSSRRKIVRLLYPYLLLWHSFFINKMFNLLASYLLLKASISSIAFHFWNLYPINCRSIQVSWTGWINSVNQALRTHFEDSFEVLTALACTILSFINFMDISNPAWNLFSLLRYFFLFGREFCHFHVVLFFSGFILFGFGVGVGGAPGLGGGGGCWGCGRVMNLIISKWMISFWSYSLMQWPWSPDAHSSNFSIVKPKQLYHDNVSFIPVIFVLVAWLCVSTYLLFFFYIKLVLSSIVCVYISSSSLNTNYWGWLHASYVFLQSNAEQSYWLD